MVINGQKVSDAEPINPYRVGGSAPTYTDNTPGVEDAPPVPKVKNWRGECRKRVRHIPTGIIYDDVQAAAIATNRSRGTLLNLCSPSRKHLNMFEYVRDDPQPGDISDVTPIDPEPTGE